MLFLALACVKTEPRQPGVVMVLQEQQATWIRNFNPFVPTSARWPTPAGVYEPLMIHSQAQGRWVPWLATDYAWNEDATELRLTLREGVRWSDGEAFTSEDVVYTFELLREVPGADLGGVWNFLESVEELEGELVFTFQRPYVPGLGALAQQPIVPEHVWSQLDDPLLFANPEPVGTGPFTEVLHFRGQYFELGANPYYWQELGVEALGFPALSSNEQASMALIRGELDWAGIFVPAVDRVFLERDPVNHQAWFPTRGGSIFLYANTTLEPLDDPQVRKAMSLAIDRELLVDVAMFGYTTPSHPTGLSPGYASWIDEGAGEGWTHHDPVEAARLLDEAGLRMGSEGWRTLPDGSPLELELTSPAGWSDWVRATRVIANDLQDIGLDVRVGGYDFSAWYERLSRGGFELSLGWSEQGPTPVPQYRALLDPASVRPVDEAAFRNWHRWGSQAAVPVLEAFDASPDPDQQRVHVAELQRIFLEEAPAIPLFPAPAWGEANHSLVTGFPTEEDPYAVLSPNSVPECLLVMTSLEVAPRGRP